MPSLHRRAAPGQASIEYVGALSLVAVVFGLAGTAVAAPDLAGTVQRAMRESLCRVAGGICTSREAQVSGLPACTLNARRTAERLSVTIGIVRGRRGDALAVAQRSDGKVTVAFLDDWQGGAGTSLGASFTSFGIAGRAEAAAGLSYQSGREWIFDDPAEAASFVARWAEREGLAGEAKAAVPIGGEREEPARPRARYVEGGIFGEAGLDAGTRVGGRRIDVDAGLEGVAVLGRKIVGDEVTWSVRVSADVAGRLGLVLASVGGQLEREAVLEYTVKDDRPSRAAIRTVTGLAGELRLSGALTDSRVLAKRLRQAVGSGGANGREGLLLDASVSLDLGSRENREAVHDLLRRPTVPAVRQLARRLDADGNVELEVHRTTTRASETGGGVVVASAQYERTERVRDLVGAWSIVRGGPLREREDCLAAAG